LLGSLDARYTTF